MYNFNPKLKGVGWIILPIWVINFVFGETLYKKVTVNMVKKHDIILLKHNIPTKTHDIFKLINKYILR